MACLFCGKKIASPVSISFVLSFKKMTRPLLCQVCLQQFIRIDSEKACLGCSRPQAGEALCPDCQRWTQADPAISSEHTALYIYNEMAKDYMKAFKFQGDLLLAGLFAEELAQALKDYQKTHYIVPIPASQTSRASRGFNQVELLLQQAGISYQDWLIYTGKGERQARKNRKERLEAKQFLATHLSADTLRQLDKPILLVDDVYTTGRTMMHAKHAFQSRIVQKKVANSLEIVSFSLFR